MTSDTHGKIAGHIRLCDVHEHGHGPLYMCEHYSDETKAEIARSSDRYIANLRDPVWCKQQIANGLPPEGLAIFKALAGVDDA